MNYAFDNDAKFVKQLHAERRRGLAQSYTNGRADAAKIRETVATSSNFLGGLLIRARHALMYDNSQRKDRQLQPVRVRSKGNS